MTQGSPSRTSPEANLLERMARLGERPYSEVGVPMLLMAEDYARPPGDGPLGEGEPALAERLTQMAAALSEQRAGHDEADAARVLEVLADETLLSPGGPAFSTLGGHAERRMR